MSSNPLQIMSELSSGRLMPISQSDFSSSFGGTLICAFVAIFLYGISVLQTYMYYLVYSKDARWIKLLVLLISTLSTTMTIFLCILVHRFLVVSYGNPSVLGSVSWSILAGAIGNYLIIVFVQAFFAKTIYHLMKPGLGRYVLITGFAVCILSQFALGIGFVAKEFQSSSIVDILPWVPKLLVPLRILRMISDIATTASLCLILFDAQVHFAPSIKLVRTIIIYAVNRLVLTTIVGLVQTILHLINPHSISALSLDYIAVHLYVNSFLASLNARKSIRGGNPVISYISDLRSHGSAGVNPPGIQSLAFATAHSYSEASEALERNKASRETGKRKMASVDVETDSYAMRDHPKPGDLQYVV